MAKKKITRIKYPLEDNVKRVMFLRPGDGEATPFNIPWATREETDAGTLLDKALNPDVGAYAYDRLRWPNQHTAGKGTAAASLTAVNGTAAVDCKRSNVFDLTLLDDTLLGNPANGYSGQVVNIMVSQGGAGNHSLTFDDDYLWIMGYTPTVSTDAGAIDLISMQYRKSIGKWLCSFLPDFTGTGSGWGSLPAGPSGIQGATGPTGPTGPAGGSSVVGMADLADVDVNPIVDRDVLIWDSYLALWIAGALTLDDLADVDTTGLADGDTLVWDAGTSQFVPGAGGGGGGGGGGYNIVKQAADQQSVNNTYVDCDLLVALDANSTYSIEIFLSITAHATPDMQVRAQYTGTTESFALQITNAIPSGTTSVGATVTAPPVLLITATTTNNITNAMVALINTTTAGNFSVQFSQQTTSAGNPVYVRKGSWMRVEKL